ncbi:PrpF domain-containing protein [Bordetella petrii]|uniref:PrpF domain-containing protein n=1 Tax=Bordetella petrii TaxID=94624 RepID=UPI00047C3514|nr:PrpF domain-containing protein [Bordetella petrii]
MSQTPGVPFHLLRGGTSKGVFFDRAAVPSDRDELAAFLLNVFGSPDPRQIDGLGGGDKLTSKAAVLGPPTHLHADVDYLFAQVGIRHAEVDYKLNCGNLSAAVAAHAIEQGYVPATEGQTAVRIHNLNTRRVIHARVPVRDGKVVYTGDLAIDGVPGTGATIELDFREATGSITGTLLPLGDVRNRMEIAGVGPVDITVIDGANLVVLVAAHDLGMLGIESPQQIDNDAALVTRMQAIRAQVAEHLGLGDYWRSRAAPSNPMLVAVQAPRSYAALNGETVHADTLDLVCRQYSTGATSKALAATVTATIGMACRLPGSIAARHLRPGGGTSEPLRIGHPAGRIMVRARVRANAALQVEQAAIYRTARTIARGEVMPRETA